jgi:hypothetical protein
MGPRSRDVLQCVSPDDFSDEGFPFATSREIDLGYARVRATRLTFVGELGWELTMPAEFAQHVFDRLTEAGQAFGLAQAGFFALNSLRMEKGYRTGATTSARRTRPLKRVLASRSPATRRAASSGGRLCSNRKRRAFFGDVWCSSGCLISAPRHRCCTTTSRSSGMA